MNFFDAIKSGFSGYFDFRGRSSRSEYWWFLLFFMVVSFVVPLLDSTQSGLISILAVLGLYIPVLAVQVRRLHDINRSGWWILISFVPIVGAILLLVWHCSKGTQGDNRFGKDPLGSEPNDLKPDT